jgi:hypothetical protein
MDELKADLRKGIFEPSVTKDLSEAFGKAEKLIDRSISTDAPEIDRAKVARVIIAEARAGETQPDLVSRAAVAKVLIESRSSAATETGESRIPDEPSRGDMRPPAEPADMPPAGPHAAPERTNENATPGTGALPSAQRLAKSELRHKPD